MLNNLAPHFALPYLTVSKLYCAYFIDHAYIPSVTFPFAHLNKFDDCNNFHVMCKYLNIFKYLKNHLTFQVNSTVRCLDTSLIWCGLSRQIRAILEHELLKNIFKYPHNSGIILGVHSESSMKILFNELSY